MEEKKFKHSLRETCSLCDQDIITNSNEWCAIPEYKGKILFNIKFYHIRCLKDLFIANYEVMSRRFQKKLADLTNGVLGNINKSNLVIE